MKPSEKEAKELGKLFPSCAGSSSSKRGPSFDPNERLYGLPDIHFFVAEAERNEFMTSLELQRGIRHVINRATLYDNVLSLYNTKLDKVINEYPFRVQFEGEMAVDVGGVTRDLFSEFFAEMYLHLFDGMCLLYPAMHASVNMATFKTVGAVISHAYLVSGVFPDRVAFPCLAAALLGPNIVISDALLRESFISSLSVHEASIVRNAMCQSGSNYSISAS